MAALTASAGITLSSLSTSALGTSQSVRKCSVDVRRPLALNLTARSQHQSSRRRSFVVRSSDTASAISTLTSPAPAVTLSERALAHLVKMRSELNKDLLLRIGVRQGGCSGYSYIMDFEERSNIREGDTIIDHEGFAMVCDPKSLLFLFGMQLDYSDALIGGGFNFSNPNASSTCGCGKSFSA
eukprot:jgi/Mesen1/640/ME000108S10792